MSNGEEEGRRGRKDPSITVSQLLLVPLFLWGHHHRNWNVHTATCDFVCGCTKVWITIEQSMRILWILSVFVAFVVCVCRPANDSFFPILPDVCVFVSLCGVCVLVCATKKWAHGRLLDVSSLTHTWIAGGYPHLGLPGCQLKPLHTHTYSAFSAPLSLWLLQPRLGSFVHSLLSSGFIVNVFRKLFSLDSANKMAESAVCPLIHHLPASFVCPFANPSFSLSLSHSLAHYLLPYGGQVLLAVGILFDIRLAKWCPNAPTKAANA